MDNIALEFKDVTGKGFGFKLKNVSMTLEKRLHICGHRKERSRKNDIV